MKFDLLPNEIFIECFEYLSAFDIFYSFDRLNYRFHTLTRNILLHLNLNYMNKSLFDKFCHKMLLNSEIKNQIISLKLSNKNTSGQLNVFLSFFSFNEFCQLRSLTLIDLNHNNFEQMKSILLLLSDFFNDLMTQTCEILFHLSPSKIQLTSILNLNFNSSTSHKTMIITSLTIHHCILEDLCQLFKYTPMMKYLYIEVLKKSSFINNELDIIDFYAIYLKKLVVNCSEANFDIFKLLLKRTPNLKILTITVKYALDIIDAEHWQNLIESSLHHLNIFNFRFIVWIDYAYNDILKKFQQFQTDFWHRQHQWYTNYELYSMTAFIYTIPYVWNFYNLKSDMKRFSISTMNNSKTFDYVTELYLFIKMINNKSDYYFQNVKSLTLMNERDLFERFLDYNLQSKKKEAKRLQFLNIIINLTNIEHLDLKSISNAISPTILLEILKQTPKLSSLVIEKPALISCFTNNQLCWYLNKMIKILDITHYDDHNEFMNIFEDRDNKFINSGQVNKFCKIFSNVEQLRCCINETDVLLFILNYLPKLKNLQVKNFPYFFQDRSSLVKMTASKRNINCIFLKDD
ncbi:unnamed protein product [Rotaria sordida]|uniref:F-box domain-containing protein n=1 Tax=Rotaria sordida TaxID=392033 RepID=A0A813YHZ3_9BILA|nr:unnamed protein product [Rotaria sordida]